MNILIDARPLTITRPGGVTKVVVELLPPLLDQLLDHHVVLGTTGWQKPTLERFLTPNSEHRHLRAPNKFLSALTASTLSSFDRFFADTQPDLLVLFNLGHIGIPNIPYLLVVHDLALFMEPAWFSPRSQAWRYAVHGKHLTKNARHLFAVSAHVKQSLIDLFHIPEERITLLPFGQPRCEPAEQLPSELKEKKYLLALGGNDRRKNASCLLSVFRALKKDPRYQDLHLVLIGKPNEPLPLDVHVIDRVSDGLLQGLFQHSSLFLYPSWYEGFGLPLHEAAHFQRPCLASTAGALPETAPSGTLFAPPGKPHTWLQGIKMMLENPDRYATHSALTRQGWEQAAICLSSFIKK